MKRKSRHSNHGSPEVDDDRERLIVDHQKYLMEFANPFDWYRMHPRPEGTEAKEIKDLLQSMPARVLETLGAIALAKQSPPVPLTLIRTILT